MGVDRRFPKYGNCDFLMDLTCPSIITERATLYIRHTQFDWLYFNKHSSNTTMSPRKKYILQLSKGVYNAKIIVIITA